MKASIPLLLVLFLASGCSQIEIDQIDYRYLEAPDPEGEGYFFVTGSLPAVQRGGDILPGMVPVVATIAGRDYTPLEAAAHRSGDRCHFRFAIEDPRLTDLVPDATQSCAVAIEFADTRGNRAHAGGTIHP